MTTTIDTAAEPRAWVGCLACYNNGRLTGQWLDADELETLADNPNDEDAPTICTRPNHEELWAMDHENLAIRDECSVAEAAARARAIDRLAAQAAQQDIPLPVALEYVTDVQPDQDAWPDALENDYRGCADSPSDYAYDYVTDTMGEPDLPDWLVIDWNATFDNLTSGASVIYDAGTLYVFEG